MTVRVYAPAVQVRLVKLVQRQNGIAGQYEGGQREVDLTPYLGDGSAIRTKKGLREDAGGFSISFSDKLDPDTMDSIYALVEPMDLIEIRATRQPDLYIGQDLPLIMRGFVSSVRRPESMSNEGTPSRAVTRRKSTARRRWLFRPRLFPRISTCFRARLRARHVGRKRKSMWRGTCNVRPI